MKTIGLVNPTIREMFTAINARFNQTLYDSEDVWWREVAEFVDTDALVEKYPVDLSVVGYRKFQGSRQYRDTDEISFDVSNEPWEDGVRIPLDIARKAAYRPYMNKADRMGAEARLFPNTLVADLLQAGETTESWDGGAFFRKGHPVNMREKKYGTYDNLFAGMPLTADNFATMIGIVESMKAANGRGMGLHVNGLLIPTSLKETARGILEKDNIARLVAANAAASETNIYKGYCSTVVAPELQNEPTNWYVLARKVGMSAAVVQLENGGSPEIVIFGENSEKAVETNYVYFNAKLFGTAALAIPHTIFRCKG